MKSVSLAAACTTAWQILTHWHDNLQFPTQLPAANRTKLLVHDVQPVNKLREYDSLDKAHTTRIDDEMYHNRSVVESSFRLFKQCYGERLTTKAWYQ